MIESLKEMEGFHSSFLVLDMLNSMSGNFSKDIKVLRTKVDFCFVGGNVNFDFFKLKYLHFLLYVPLRIVDLYNLPKGWELVGLATFMLCSLPTLVFF